MNIYIQHKLAHAIVCQNEKHTQNTHEHTCKTHTEFPQPETFKH